MCIIHRTPREPTGFYRDAPKLLLTITTHKCQQSLIPTVPRPALIIDLGGAINKFEEKLHQNFRFVFIWLVGSLFFRLPLKRCFSVY